VIPRSRSDLDITDPAALQQSIAGQAIDWVINAAAYTAVDQAEDERDEAGLVNDTAVAHLSRATAAAGSRLLHFSTDFVFDGAASTPYGPESQPNPLSVYGATKLAGEGHVRQLAGGGIVLRTAWVYAAAGRNFLLTMLRLMRNGKNLRVVRDQVGTPTSANSVAAAAWALMEANAPGGIYHWTADGVASWYDFAVAIQEEALARGLLRQEVPVVPIRSSEYPTRAARPAYSVLDTDSTRTIVNLPPAHWRHGLRTVLDEL